MKDSAINTTISKKNPIGNKFCEKCGTYTVKDGSCRNIEHNLRKK